MTPSSGMSRYSSSQSRGADSRDGYSHSGSNRSHAHSSSSRSRPDSRDDYSHQSSRSSHSAAYDDSDDEGSSGVPHSSPHFTGSECPQNPGEFHRAREPIGLWNERMRERIDREMAAESEDRQRSDSRYSSSSRTMTSGSNGGSYSSTRTITDGSSHRGSSHGGSASHSRSSRTGSSQFTRGPSALSRGASTHGESRGPSGASRLLGRITGGQSSGGRSSHASNESVSRDVARRF